VLYIDTSVLLVYTLTQTLKPVRYASTRKRHPSLRRNFCDRTPRLTITTGK
jgi:hypothetical protein